MFVKPKDRGIMTNEGVAIVGDKTNKQLPDLAVSDISLHHDKI